MEEICEEYIYVDIESDRHQKELKERVRYVEEGLDDLLTLPHKIPFFIHQLLIFVHNDYRIEQKKNNG